MSTDLNASFNEQYMNISAKLKKRFMRKPNISEATNEFVALGIQAENSEQPAFAAHAYTGAAKCEFSAGNFLSEAEHYLTAARQYMKAEKKLCALNFSRPDRENLEAAIGCYMLAFTKYPEKSPLRTSILMEIANNLRSLDHKFEAVTYYQQALDRIEDTSMKLWCLHCLLNMLMDCGKYDQALETANSICDSNFKIPENIQTEVELSRILLALHVQPTEENKPESLKTLFNNLMNDEENDDSPFNTNLKLKLQSVVISYTTDDQHSLIHTCSESKHLFTTQQRELLETLIRCKESANASLT